MAIKFSYTHQSGARFVDCYGYITDQTQWRTRGANGASMELERVQIVLSVWPSAQSSLDCRPPLTVFVFEAPGAEISEYNDGGAHPSADVIAPLYRWLCNAERELTPDETAGGFDLRGLPES